MDLNFIDLNILTLNVWGIPLISSDRKPRIADIADELKSGQYDVVSLQEVWSEADRQYLQEATKSRLPYSHYFHSGVLGAGLLVLSKYPIVDTIFHAWLLNGYPHRLQHGDWFAGKGVGLCRIRLAENTYLHLYNTHLHAEYDSKYFNYKPHRIIQAFDTAQFIASTRGDAALQILAGDLNSNPADFAYKVFLCIADLIDSCNLCDIATYRNRENTYTSRSVNGERIDHILYRPGSRFNASVVKYKLALQKNGNQCHQQGQHVPRSLSDHEPVHVLMRLKPFSAYHDHSTHQTTYPLMDKVQVAEHAINFCIKHLKQLNFDQMFYSFCSFTLFALAFAEFEIPICNGCPILLGYLVKLAIFVVGVYFMYMATIWNLMERNGIRSIKTAMELKMNSWLNFPNSVFSSMPDEPTGDKQQQE